MKLLISLSLCFALLTTTANPFLGVAGSNVVSSVSGDDCMSGSLVFSWHMEDMDVTLGTPPGCSAGETLLTNVSLATLSSVVAQDGTQSLNVSTSGDYALTSGTMVNPAEGTVEFYIYWNTLNSGINLWKVQLDSNNEIFIESRPSGTCRISYESGGVVVLSGGTAASSFTTATWHKVTGKWRTDGTTPALSITVDASSNNSGGSAVTAIASPLVRLEVGQSGGTGSYNYNIDNLKIWDVWQP